MTTTQTHLRRALGIAAASLTCFFLSSVAVQAAWQSDSASRVLRELRLARQALRPAAPDPRRVRRPADAVLRPSDARHAAERQRLVLVPPGRRHHRSGRQCRLPGRVGHRDARDAGVGRRRLRERAVVRVLAHQRQGSPGPESRRREDGPRRHPALRGTRASHAARARASGQPRRSGPLDAVRGHHHARDPCRRVSRGRAWAGPACRTASAVGSTCSSRRSTAPSRSTRPGFARPVSTATGPSPRRV